MCFVDHAHGHGIIKKNIKRKQVIYGTIDVEVRWIVWPVS